MREEGNKAHAVTIGLAQDVIDFIEARMLDELTPTDVADHFYASVASVNVLFKIAFDMPIMEYVRRRRLSLAGQELLTSQIRVIDLALKYGYETPEAFTKAFTRFHGIPPSFVRRLYSRIRNFRSLSIRVELSGGFDRLTESDSQKQASLGEIGYHESIKGKGGTTMKHEKRYDLHISDMTYREDWRVLLAISKELEGAGIPHKVDGKTMIFAHGLEFELEKICLTFHWRDQKKVMDFFGYDGKTRETEYPGFRYFDASYEGRKVRCMFFGTCEDEMLFRNTDAVDVDGQTLRVQSLEFYLENAEPRDEFYEMVERYLKRIGTTG